MTGTAAQTARLQRDRDADAGMSLRVCHDTTRLDIPEPAAVTRRWSVRGVSALRLLTAADDLELRAGAVAALTEAIA